MGYGSAAPIGVTTTLGAPVKNIGDCHIQKLFHHISHKIANNYFSNDSLLLKDYASLKKVLEGKADAHSQVYAVGIKER
ncbi:MAG: hypothetical protein OXU36_09255 [Candidatus Poribacteria bacterium]|nr:hypothetical protein [Candidatus Poribacteria bacterium]